MLIKTVGGAIKDWWGEVYSLALANFVWFVLLFTVVGAPPATAALLALGREAMFRRKVNATDIFRYLRPYFGRSWALALLLLGGLIIAGADIFFFLAVMSGFPGLVLATIIFYIALLWLQVHYYAWAMMVLRPDLKLGQTLRNSFIITMRHPLFGLIITVLITILLVASVILPPLLALISGSLIALLSIRGMAAAVPELLTEEDSRELADIAAADAAPNAKGVE